MTLVSDIIRDAYREGNLIAIAADPTIDEQTEGLRLLNRIVESVYGSEVGEKFNEVLIGRNNITRPQGFPWYENVPPVTDWFVPDNTRLILNLTSAQTVYLNPTPEDGDRFAVLDKSGNLDTYNLVVDANGRSIAGAGTATLATASISYEYVYRSDTGEWARVSPLVAADTFPFPGEFEDLFVIGLAMRINPRNGVVIDQQSGNRYSELMTKFKARYRQKEEVGSEAGLVNLPTMKGRRYSDSRKNNSDFDFGYPNR